MHLFPLAPASGMQDQTVPIGTHITKAPDKSGADLF